MKNVVVYGLGQQFENVFVRDSFVKSIINEIGINIKGLFDKKYVGQTYMYDNREYVIYPLEQYVDLLDCKFIVTSKKYYNEISEELVSYGFREEQIELLDDLVKLCINYKIKAEQLFGGKKGIEIGGPSDIFKCIYEQCYSCDGVNFSSDTVWWKRDNAEQYEVEGQTIGKVFIADATDLSIIGGLQYDFFVSSNNLEHIANPIKALKEGYRILKKEGIMLVVVPMKDRTFDHNREYTTFEHMYSDYLNDVQEDDLSHISEIIEKHDYEKDVLCGGKEAFVKRSEMNYENRCLHHHVFNRETMEKLFEYIKLEIIVFFEALDCYWIIGKKI